MPSSNSRYQLYTARKKLRERYKRMGITNCPVCGQALDWEHPYLPNSAEIDEIYPVSKLPKEMRGRAAVDPNNTQVLCRTCNRLKSNHLPSEFRRFNEPEKRAAAGVKTSQRW